MNFIRHGVKLFAALALLGMAATLAAFNVEAWWAEGLVILAVLAAFFEAIGFVFAVMVEDAVRARRIDRAAVCFVILIGCAAFNTVGGHKAWERSQAAAVTADQSAAQAALDARIAALRQTIADAQARIDRVPLPDPLAMSRRQEEARASWEALTAEDRAVKARAQAELDRSDVVAPEAPPAFPAWLVWAFLGFLEVCKALGLWSLGLAASRPRLVVNNTAKGEMSASEAARHLVALRRDRQKAS